MTNPDLLRVSAIRVRKLFGTYDHDVVLKARERLTIIHGPNGVGKTAFLSLTSALLSGKYGELAETPFEEFWIEFSDGTRAGVSKVNPNANPKPGAGREVRLYFGKEGEANQYSQSAPELFDPSRLAAQIERESPYLNQVSPEQWHDRRTDEVISASEVIARYSDALPEKSRNRLLKDLPQLKHVREQIRVHLIEAQRLIRFTTVRPQYVVRSGADRSVVDTVQEYSRDLKKRITDALGTYAKESQRLDQSFPQRLLSPFAVAQSSGDLREDFEQIDKLRSRLTRLGLLDDSESGGYPFSLTDAANLDPIQQTALRLYVDDTRAKLSTLEDLAQRLEVLLDNINRKFRNKELRISREKGLYALGPNAQDSLSLSSLSSGEQHEIVLMYDLLFKVTKSTLVLLDEPELSLHVSWQKSFLADLASVIAIVEFDVILATHSPYIIGDRSDLMVELATE